MDGRLKPQRYSKGRTSRFQDKHDGWLNKLTFSPTKLTPDSPKTPKKKNYAAPESVNEDEDEGESWVDHSFASATNTYLSFDQTENGADDLNKFAIVILYHAFNFCYELKCHERSCILLFFQLSTYDS